MAWLYCRSTPCVDGSRRRQPKLASTKGSQAWPGSTLDPRHAWMKPPAPTKVGAYQRQPGMAWIYSRATPCVDESRRRQPRLASTKGSQAWPGSTVDQRHAWMNFGGANQGWRLPKAARHGLARQ